MKILIELPTWMGDALMTTPAIENIISCHKDARVTLIGSSISIELLKNHPNVHETHIFEKKYFKFFRIFKKLGNFDVFFSFRGSYRARIFKFFISANKKYQFDKNKYSDFHQVDKYNSFINESLKIKRDSGKIVLHELVRKNKKNNKILGINPGASYGNAKRWYPQEFANVAAALSSKYDIIIFGGRDEVDLALDIEKHLSQKNIKNFQNLADKTSIKELTRQIANLDLFVTGDSGPMHLAAAFQIPTVAIFGPTDEIATSQWKNDKGIVVKSDLECQPCLKRECPLKHHNCMKEIKASDVLKVVNQIS